MLFRAIVVAVAIAAQLGVLGPLFLIPVNSADLGVRISHILSVPLLLTLLAGAALAWCLYRALLAGRYRVAALAAAFGCYLYIQFYVLVPDLGAFDGRTANFAGHTWTSIAEAALITTLLAFALLAPKAAFATLAPLLGFLSLAEGVMVGAATLSYKEPAALSEEATPADLVSPAFFKTSLGRIRGITELSQRNVILIVVDTLQGDAFSKIVSEHPGLLKSLDGFTFYRDAAGGFPFTGLSVLGLLTGTRYDGTETIPAYQKRVAPGQLAAQMDKLGYHVDLLPLDGTGPFLDAKHQHCRDITTLYNLAAMRQLPTPLKAWQYNDSKFRWISEICGKAPATRQEMDTATLDKLKDDSRVTRTEKPSFKFMHFFGMHPPSLLTGDCKVRKKRHRTPEAVSGQGACVLRKLGTYLRRLKELGVYDDSMILITADHGTLYGPGFQNISGPGVPARVISAAHPALLFKDFGATGPMRFSDAPVTLQDIYPTILKRAGGNPEGSAGRDLAGEPQAGRVREFLYFRRANEIANRDYVKSEFWYTITGPALDPNSWYLSPALKDGKTVRLPDAWLSESGARIRVPAARSQRLTIETELETLGPDQRVHVTVNGRAAASWEAPAGLNKRTATVDLQPEEQGIPIVVLIRSEEPDVELDEKKRLATVKQDEERRAAGVRAPWIAISPAAD